MGWWYIAPELVHLERAVDEVDRTVGRVLTYGMPDVTISGVVGRPTESTVTSGRKLFTAIVDDVAELLTRARAEADPLPLRTNRG